MWGFASGVPVEISNIAVSAGTQSVSTGTVILSNSNGISFGMSQSTVTAQLTPVKMFEYGNMMSTATCPSMSLGGAAGGVSSFMRISVPNQITATRLDMLITYSNGAGGVRFQARAAAYSLSGSTASRLATVTSAGSTNQASGDVTPGNNQGFLWLSMPICNAAGVTLTAGGEYLVGIDIVPLTVGTSNLQLVGSLAGFFAPGGNAHTDYFCHGVITSNTNTAISFADSYHMSQISQTVINDIYPYFRIMGAI